MNLWAALSQVADPEFPISVVDMGLIYDVRVDGGEVTVVLTFTSTACPCRDYIKEDIAARLLREPGVAAVRFEVVWDPPWTPDRISAAGREALKKWGVVA